MTTLTESSTASDEQPAAEELVGRLFAAALGSAELFTIRLGDVHGLYRAMSDGPATAEEIVKETGLDRRYAVEWLQAQAISGLVTVDGPDVHSARFALAPGVRSVLLDETNPMYAGGMPAIPVALGRAYPLIEQAFRTGAGVAYSEYGPEAVSAQAALNRPAYVNSLVAEWLPAMPDVEKRLGEPGARVADVGTGVGWSAIELAKAFPELRVDGYDNDEDSISQARRNAAEHGVADRVDFEVRDASAVAERAGSYDVVMFFECLHDLARPADALSAARDALVPGGCVLVMDENVAETLTAPGDEVERFFAAAGLTWCIPQGRVESESQVIGPLMRPAALGDLATRAGYAGVEILPIEHPFWRFYRLNP